MERFANGAAYLRALRLGQAAAARPPGPELVEDQGAEPVQGVAFVGCTDCSESWADLAEGEQRHLPTCPRVPALLAENLPDIEW